MRDTARKDRAILLLLTGYALAWTIYGTLAKSSQDLHPDMVELISWSRDLSLGYPKHPPLGAWVVWIWFKIFPLTDWSFYLLAMLMPTLALWVAWRLSADYLDIDKRIVGLALLMIMPFYNFHALKYNANTLLMPAWAMTTLAFLRSYRNRSAPYAALAGVGAALSMLAKYWTVFLIVGLIVAALMDPRRRYYFLSAAPWITVIAGFAVLCPHLIWLHQHDFISVGYALARHAATSVPNSLDKVFIYVSGIIGFAAAPVALALLVLRPSGAAIADMIRPLDRERRLVAAAFWGPLLLPVVGTLAIGSTPTALWSMPAWMLLPVILLSPPTVKIAPFNLQLMLGLVIAEPLVMVIAAPAIAIVIHRGGIEPPAAYGRLLASETEHVWRQATPRPLRFVGCDVADEVVAYAEDKPHALPWRVFKGDVADAVYADKFNWPPSRAANQGPSDTKLTADGMALVCSADRADWVESAAARAARDPASRRIDLVATRDFLGFLGRPERYVIFIIPPRP